MLWWWCPLCKMQNPIGSNAPVHAEEGYKWLLNPHTYISERGRDGFCAWGGQKKFRNIILYDGLYFFSLHCHTHRPWYYIIDFFFIQLLLFIFSVYIKIIKWLCVFMRPLFQLTFERTSIDFPSKYAVLTSLLAAAAAAEEKRKKKQRELYGLKAVYAGAF